MEITKKRKVYFWLLLQDSMLDLYLIVKNGIINLYKYLFGYYYIIYCSYSFNDFKNITNNYICYHN